VFHRASGLRINISKSKLLGISVEASKLNQAAAKIGCAVLNTPFTYLGSRVGGNMSRIQAWNDIIEGMVSRLSKWKVKTLSICGRLTLLKSVLGALPIYHMSIFKVPMKVLKNMEAIRARFFNDNGGLGVSSLYALNRALLFKWVWRFISQKKSIWVRVIEALHGEDGKIGKHINHSYPSIWISIIKEVESLKDKGMDLLQFISPVLGNGISTSFWEVPWRGDVAFKVLAPRIYALETMKNIVVASKLSHNDMVWSLRRRPRDGIEQAQLTLIKNCMEGVILSNSKDRWVWNLVGSGEFSVASVIKYIDDHSLPSESKKTKEVPIKINILAWKVKNDGLPTRFTISRRGMEIDTITCPLCDVYAESTRHIFFSCKVFCEVMRKIARWWELEYNDTNSYEEWLDWLIFIRLPLNLKKVVKGVQSQTTSQNDFPTMVLDKSCLNKEEITLRLLGKVKEVASLPNLKMVLAKEGYTSTDLKYMGGLWVMIKFQEIFNRIASRWGSLLNGEELEDGDFHSNILCICSKMKTIVSESFKMAFRGKIYWVRAIEVPGWVPDFEDDIDEMSYDSLNDDEEPMGEASIRNEMDSEGSVEEIPDTCFDEVLSKQNLNDNSVNQNNSHSEDPFGIYEDSHKNGDGDGSGAASGNQVEENSMNVEQAIDINVEKQDNVKDGFQRDTNESNCSGHFKKSTAPRTGGSILHLIDDLVKVGQTMGFDMSGCIKNMEEIIESQGVNDETKMEKIDLWCIKRCWGNLSFDYTYSEAVGNSGVILCIWDPTVFQKENETISDYFVIVRAIEMVMRLLWELLMKSVMPSKDLAYLNARMPWRLWATPFKFFHYWFEIDGFDKFVEESWKDNNVIDQNPFFKFMKKLKFLKMKIQTWVSKLRTIDSKIDRGEGNDSDINRRHNIIRLIRDIENVDTLEMAQKVKIKWAIEGDENSKIYHGMINKKRGSSSGIQLVKEFSKRLSVEQNANLEGEVSNEEIKNAVWGCGIDKAPGPDDKQILDGPFILNELVQWSKSKKKQTMVFKVDFEKAPTQEFQFYKGLKQGDPLYPFLFILVMESLHTSFQRVVDVRLFKGVKLSPTILMTHLFYADDAIFMGQWNQANIDTL
nr:RNA-directed DNA polymerase, eukaryota, reverse transcriptase zinc-binding domain protein [Tanacetum cinerariifolium]